MEATEELTQLTDQNTDLTKSNAHHVGYSTQLRTAMHGALRYLAYMNDVGEAFRPVVPRWVVRSAYGVSWTYVAGDVTLETWKAKHRGPNPGEAATFTENERLAFLASKRAAFQALASIAFPGLTIHTLVRYSKRAFQHFTGLSARTRAWAPTAIGLSIIPFLPYIFDKPVEVVTDAAAEWIENRIAENRAKAKEQMKEKIE